MSEYPEIAVRFARETQRHEMTVLHDDGLYRHLKFTDPEDRSFYRFDLITWPHNLVIRADGMTFAFAVHPTEDWFDLARKSSHKGSINPGYWQQKVTAGREAVESYAEELLKKEIEDTVRQWLEDGDVPRLREAVHEHFFGEMADYNVEYEAAAHQALHEFSFKPEGAEPRELPYQFYDWHEWRLRDYSWQFLWACHAIVWGIGRYDKVRGYGLQQLAEPARQAVAV